MAVPEYTELMLPLLRRAAKSPQGIAERDLAQAVAGEIGLSPVDAARLLPSGDMTVLDARVRWARAYLEKSGFVDISDGKLHIVKAGRDFLRKSEPVDEAPAAASGHIEKIAEAHALHRAEVSGELLRRVHSMSPAFFEQLIIDVILAMGYGCSRAGVASRLGRSGDGGVDGEIFRDELGLERLLLQAKRYMPGSQVALSEVRDFAGALEARRARAGVFVTTARFPASARSFVEQVRTPIALLDGEELSALLLRHGIGVRMVRNYAVHHLDVDYFRE